MMQLTVYAVSLHERSLEIDAGYSIIPFFVTPTPLFKLGRLKLINYTKS